MKSITQDMRARLSLIQYSLKHGIIRAAIKYKVNGPLMIGTTVLTPPLTS